MDHYRMCVYIKNDTKRKEENLYIQSISPINIFIISKVISCMSGSCLFTQSLFQTERINIIYVKRNVNGTICLFACTCDN